MARRTTQQIIEDIEKKCDEKQNELKQLKAQLNAQKRKLKEQERKERTKRLIKKGACIESLIPKTKDMTDDDFMKFIEDLIEKANLQN